MQRLFRVRGESLKAQREMRAATIVHDGVYLVENHSPHAAQHFAAGVRRKEQIKRLRRRDQNVRRRFDKRPTLRCGRVAGANFGAKIDIMTFRLQQFTNSSERFLQIFADVVAQSLERRNVNNLRFVR